MKRTRKDKCLRMDGVTPTFCLRMNEYLAQDKWSPRNKRGMYLLVLSDIEKMGDDEANAHHVYGVSYKESAKDMGLMLNWCPWCGHSLRWWPAQKNETEEQAEARSVEALA